MAAAYLPAHISILANGPTGIGKSHIVHSVGKKLNPPRIQPTTSAKASNEVVETEQTVDTNVEVDAEQTVKAVMEALVTVGDDASKHLSSEDKKFIKTVCLKEDSPYTNVMYVLIILLI